VTLGPSFNELICPPQQRRRDGEAERLGGFEVDDELEFRGLRLQAKRRAEAAEKEMRRG
jgi:hypothetical protein